MSNEATAKWTKIQPDEDGYYWWRYDRSYTPEPVEVRDGMFYSISEPDPTSVSVGQFLGPITPEQFAEVAQLRAETLKGICVYCGYIEQYESLEHKASEAGNAMRVAHIRQCEARPELKLIAYGQQLIDEVGRLREALEPLVIRLEKMMLDGPECDCPAEEHLCGWPDLQREVGVARAALSGKKEGE